MEPLLQAAPAHAVKGVHRGDGFTHPPGKLRYDLTAGVVVDLVAVVLRGVVAGGDHDAALTAQFPHRIGERRSGHQLGIDPHMHAVGSQNPGCLLGKFPGEMAAVIGDGNAGTVMILQQHPGQTLGGFAHCEAVHPGSAGIQDAPQSGSAEFQFPAEALCQQFRISGDLRSRAASSAPALSGSSQRLSNSIFIVLSAGVVRPVFSTVYHSIRPRRVSTVLF